jgi:hypothetical protein
MSKANGSFASTYFAELRRMTDLLSDLYTPLQAHEWLLAKHKLLDDMSPAQLIARGRSHEVEHLIEQIREGVFL